MGGGRGAVDCNLLNPTHGSTPITNIVIIIIIIHGGGGALIVTTCTVQVIKGGEFPYIVLNFCHFPNCNNFCGF